jgi:2-(1,2-epoxy-1,2-dihydrophenyl)acetyl-CoA isomerase
VTILVEDRAAYRRVALNRPERLNALDAAMAEALVAALDAAEADANCRALLLTGIGRGFCAGQDLTAIEGLPASEIPSLIDHYNSLIRRLRSSPLPIVCAVNGIAAGAGANIALACDIVLATRSASFVQAFARIDLIPDCGGTWFLPRLVGAARARALAMLAEPISAEIAAEWGLIWRAVDDDRLIPEAEALAERLANGPTVALGMIKHALDAGAGNGLDDQLDLERDLQGEAAASPDHAEGVRAFLEKRPPVFGGKRN